MRWRTQDDRRPDHFSCRWSWQELFFFEHYPIVLKEYVVDPQHTQHADEMKIYNERLDMRPFMPRYMMPCRVLCHFRHHPWHSLPRLVKPRQVLCHFKHHGWGQGCTPRQHQALRICSHGRSSSRGCALRQHQTL
jgi:hypothetical protein